MERGASLGLAVDLNASFQELPVVGRSVRWLGWEEADCQGCGDCGVETKNGDSSRGLGR